MVGTHPRMSKDRLQWRPVRRSNWQACRYEVTHLCSKHTITIYLHTLSLNTIITVYSVKVHWTEFRMQISMKQVEATVTAVGQQGQNVRWLRQCCRLPVCQFDYWGWWRRDRPPATTTYQGSHYLGWKKITGLSSGRGTLINTSLHINAVTFDLRVNACQDLYLYRL